MYGVVVCSRCEKARAVDLRQKTATCECGSRIMIQRSRVYFKSDSQGDVAEAVRQMSARLSGAPEGPPDEVKIQERPEDLESALVSFFRDGVKTRRQLKALLTRLGVKDSDKTIDRLLATGVIFAPEKDHLRLV
jgi:DNA-directed RNA polymerase subunit RPC12/RpoP